MIVTELNQIGISQGSKLPQMNRLLNLEIGNNLAHWQDQDMRMLSVRHLYCKLKANEQGSVMV